MITLGFDGAAPTRSNALTAVVRCDAIDCDETVTTTTSGCATVEAWNGAYDRGWRNRSIDKPYGGVTQGDLCPYHADRYDRGLL